LLESVSEARGVPLPPVRLSTWEALRRMIREQRGTRPSRPRLSAAHSEVSVVRVAPRDIARPVPTLVGCAGSVEGQTPGGAAASAADRMLLDLVGRHPFLAVGDLASLLGWRPATALRRLAWLRARGLLRVLDQSEVGRLRTFGAPAAAVLVELTPAGLRLVAAQQGLTLGAAARFNGLVGGGPLAQGGVRLQRARRLLLRHLAHTRGADGFFLCMHAAGRARDSLRRSGVAGVGGGADGTTRDGLVVWRNAVACARGHVRPDGYGVWARGDARHGFFLEYDRGTERGPAYRRKLGAYYDYRDSGRAARDYDGFPTILLVTPDTDVERRVAQVARAAAVGRTPELPLLLTCEWRFRGDVQRGAHLEGLLGPIWRTPESATRRCWPEP
ncbi:MAG: replication-relaxation family protein, partial [Chloroflexota bacterium]|nr:replication-relaxation family protein [Chloroflexota bacterium]